jgi:hypothetical protein
VTKQFETRPTRTVRFFRILSRPQKSQQTPTVQSSNVENKAFVSMAEVGSIGRAWKGMVQTGEKLYAKHQDIKTDNEILEKIKEVNNGTDNYTGLSETKIDC